MSYRVATDTPLAEALDKAIQTKVAELGWGDGGAEASTLAEYIILMLANEKSQQAIANDISEDLLGLSPEDQTASQFAKWLFEQVEILGPRFAGHVPLSLGANKVDDSMADAYAGGAAADVMDMETGKEGIRDSAEFKAPKGPKAMRNGGLRDGSKRILGQINRALGRPNDPLRGVRGQSSNERITKPPSGPRGRGFGRGNQRMPNGRAQAIAQGLFLNGMPNGPGMNPGMQPGLQPGMMHPSMNGPGPSAMHSSHPMAQQANFMMPGQPDALFAMMEQQSRMLQTMQHQLMMQQKDMNSQNDGHPGQGRSLFERTSRPGGNFRGQGGGHFGQPSRHEQNDAGSKKSEGAQAEGKAEEDVDMDQPQRERPNSDEMVCNWNLRCQNRDCKFAHQSPAAPPGVSVDVKDVCSFGAACKNRKCAGRHPSPAAKIAHQSEMDCKFFPNCTNPTCPFKHPSMPPCRNGGECKVPNCQFTHIKTPCKFNPCMNRYCPFSHEEGQRGTFHDRVWTADGGAAEHPSERKFVADEAVEEMVLPDEVALEGVMT